jgi:CRP-like cAMP-binding protein
MGDAATLFVWTDLPGHASYVLIAISYWLTDIYWLRVTAVAGLCLEIIYFGLAGGAMHTGIGWDVVFILINLYQIYRLVAEQHALKAIEDLHLLKQGAFAGLDRRQLARLVRTGAWRTFEPPAKLTQEGLPVQELVLICDGNASVESHGRVVAHLHGGAFVGEMAFISGNPASATVTVERPTRAFVFDMARLRQLAETDDLLAVALHRVIGRDLTQKLAEGDLDPTRPSPERAPLVERQHLDQVGQAGALRVGVAAKVDAAVEQDRLDPLRVADEFAPEREERGEQA